MKNAKENKRKGKSRLIDSNNLFGLVWCCCL